MVSENTSKKTATTLKLNAMTVRRFCWDINRGSTTVLLFWKKSSSINRSNSNRRMSRILNSLKRFSFLKARKIQTKKMQINKDWCLVKNLRRKSLKTSWVFIFKTVKNFKKSLLITILTQCTTLNRKFRLKQGY